MPGTRLRTCRWRDVRAELLAEEVERRGHVFGPSVGDVERGVGFEEAPGRSTDGGALGGKSVSGGAGFVG